MLQGRGCGPCPGLRQRNSPSAEPSLPSGPGQTTHTLHPRFKNTEVWVCGWERGVGDLRAAHPSTDSSSAPYASLVLPLRQTSDADPPIGGVNAAHHTDAVSDGRRPPSVLACFVASVRRIKLVRVYLGIPIAPSPQRSDAECDERRRKAELNHWYAPNNQMMGRSVAQPRGDEAEDCSIPSSVYPFATRMTHRSARRARQTNSRGVKHSSNRLRHLHASARTSRAISRRLPLPPPGQQAEPYGTVLVRHLPLGSELGGQSPQVKICVIAETYSTVPNTT